MSKKLELEHLPMNSDRKSQKKKAWKYLKQQQVIGIIVLLFVLVTDSWSGVKKKKKNKYHRLSTREIYPLLHNPPMQAFLLSG